VVDTDTAAWLDSSPEMRAQVTATIALGRIGEAADIADIVAFLASDDAAGSRGSRSKPAADSGSVPGAESARGANARGTAFPTQP
jgi:NAD(P)-dependent dehydrogenase (short-subunit alcohol dehydrogenase family)